MNEALRALLTDSALPNLHAAVVHLPLALLAVAPLLDLGCMAFRRRVWLDRAASTPYVVGGLGVTAVEPGSSRRPGPSEPVQD